MFKLNANWIEENWDELVDALREADYEATINWTMEYMVVVDEDGKIRTREFLGGSGSYFEEDEYIHRFYYGPEVPDDSNNIEEIAWDSTHDPEATESYYRILEDLCVDLRREEMLCNAR